MQQPRVFFFVLTALLTSTAAWAETNKSKSILLYPNSTVEVTRSDRCAVIQNISDALVFVPLDREAWLNFVAGQYPTVSVKECSRP